MCRDTRNRWGVVAGICSVVVESLARSYTFREISSWVVLSGSLLTGRDVFHLFHTSFNLFRSCCRDLNSQVQVEISSSGFITISSVSSAIVETSRDAETSSAVAEIPYQSWRNRFRNYSGQGLSFVVVEFSSVVTEMLSRVTEIFSVVVVEHFFTCSNLFFRGCRNRSRVEEISSVVVELSFQRRGKVFPRLLLL